MVMPANFPRKDLSDIVSGFWDLFDSQQRPDPGLMFGAAKSFEKARSRYIRGPLRELQRLLHSRRQADLAGETDPDPEFTRKLRSHPLAHLAAPGGEDGRPDEPEIIAAIETAAVEKVLRERRQRLLRGLFRRHAVVMVAREPQHQGQDFDTRVEELVHDAYTAFVTQPGRLDRLQESLSAYLWGVMGNIRGNGRRRDARWLRARSEFVMLRRRPKRRAAPGTAAPRLTSVQETALLLKLAVRPGFLSKLQQDELVATLARRAKKHNPLTDLREFEMIIRGLMTGLTCKAIALRDLPHLQPNTITVRIGRWRKAGVFDVLRNSPC